MIPAWVEGTIDAQISTGLRVDEALHRALELRKRLRAGGHWPGDFRLDADLVEALHALGALLSQTDDEDPKRLLDDASAAFEFILALDWPQTSFGGREELLSRFAFLSWRYGRLSRNPAAEFKWLGTHSSLDGSSARTNAERTLATTEEQRLERFDKLNSEDSEQLLAICELLGTLVEVEPARARDEAGFFYRFVETSTCCIGVFDERDYYLGEFAHIAGGACRFLARRDEARRWFDRAEASFVLAQNGNTHVARVAYQRLALKAEERDFESVLEFAPRWRSCFARLELRENALKCSFLEAVALKETDRPEEAKRAFKEIRQEASRIQLDRLVALASENLFQIHAFLGETEEAIAEAEKASAILRRLNNRVNLAKVQLGVGYLLRAQGRLLESVGAFRDAQKQFSEIQMHADVAATHLVLADLLLDAGQPAQAEREIRAALPAIDELKLVPEGIAAFSLLRDSLRRRQIDRQALRSLNGYFEELGS